MDDKTMDLFAEPPRKPRALARRTDPVTSHEAAKATTPHLTELQAQILDALQANRKGLTTHEISPITGIEWGSVTPRMLPMESMGMVMRNGTRIPPGRKRPSIVWMAIV